MEFGSVSAEVLNDVDFRLPADSAWNNGVLSGNLITHPKVYVGCTRWVVPEWVGKIYPPNIKAKDYLPHYLQQYNCVELNATHYKLYDAATIEKWVALASFTKFKFCPKMYKGITHDGRLDNKQLLTTAFINSIRLFKQHLGPTFIQLSDSFSVERKNELLAFITSLPNDIEFFLELRHASWFANQPVLHELLHFLQANKIGFVITDTAGRRECCHMQLTIPKVFIRYVGNSLHTTDYVRIDAWVQRIKYWVDNGIEEVYFFMHMHDEATSPELTVYLVDKINEVCKLNLAKPIFYEANMSKQQSLF